MRLDSAVIPIKERCSMLFLRYGRLDVEDGALVLVDEGGTRMQIPLGGLACLLLEPGTTVSHAAVALAADCGTLLLWIGEGGVRLYSAGQPGGARADRLLYQARLALDDSLRLKVVRAMYRFRFGEESPQKRSIEQLRGIEGARVKALYKLLASRYRLSWGKRSYDPRDWDTADPLNQAVSVANHCLYGICEAAVLAAGYAPAIGFIHTGKPLSFVYDIADLFKFDTVIPAAFQTVAKKCRDIPREVRLCCRDMFREQHLLRRIIPVMEEMLAAAGESLPPPHPEAMPVAIPEIEGLGDVGHRN
ncbi:MAG: type I-E CRISPR-associated endonuclease Cas1 [Desulfovibrio sp.]|nr:type I-E CRISPR-associated endonuclease Cas1 [Desulfovibrio sp.]